MRGPPITTRTATYSPLASNWFLRNAPGVAECRRCNQHRKRSAFGPKVAPRAIMNKYILPDLAYDYGALEPHISGRIMELHHKKHHAGYVKKANEVLEQLDEAREKGDFTKLAALERALAFNLSGHVLHSL